MGEDTDVCQPHSLQPPGELFTLKLDVLPLSPPGTFPVTSAAALTWFLLDWATDGPTEINVLWPAPPSIHYSK